MAFQDQDRKKKPTKDGRNAKQRRADKKRAARLAGVPHLDSVAGALQYKRTHQFHRWVTHNMRTGNILGYQNEIRWGFKTGMTHLISDEAQWAIERFYKEMAAALSCVNSATAAASSGVPVKDQVWVDDWFDNADDGRVAAASTSVGATAVVDGTAEDDKGVEVEQDNENEDGEGDDGREVFDDSDCMSGVEMEKLSLSQTL